MRRLRGATPALAVTLTTILFLTATASVGVDPAAQAAPAPPGGAPDAPRFVVGFHHEPGAADVARLLAAGATAVVPLSTIDAAVVAGPAAMMPAVADWADVAYVEADGRTQFLTYQNDDQTGVAAVRSGAAPIPRGYTGTGVTVAAVDSGIDTNHPDVAEQVIHKAHFEAAWVVDAFVDDDGRDALVEASPGYAPVTTHGLSVGGILAGTGEAAMGVDMRGVAPNTSIVDLNVCCSFIANQAAGAFDASPEAWGSDHLIAFDYILRHHDDPQYPGGIRVVTNSWGFGPNESYPEEAFTAILRETVDRGITVVFAAGNGGPAEDTVIAPQKLVDEVITVGVSCPAVDGFDHWAPDAPCGLGDLAVYSARGEAVDVVAPAAGVWTPKTLVHTVGNQELTEPRPGYDADAHATANNRLWYGVFGGTSAAAPYVAGVIAMMLEANPDLTPGQVEQILKDTAQDYGPVGYDTGWGWGEVRADAAVQAALDAGGS